MRKKAEIIKDFSQRLADNQLSDFEYAMWISDYKEFDAKVLLAVYEDSDKKVCFRRWVNFLLYGRT